MSTQEAPGTFDGPAPPVMEITSGAMPYLEFLQRIHKKLSPHFYLEIGVRHGRSLALASCRAVAVDPYPEITVPLSAKVELYRETSDEFFQRDGLMELHGRIDLAFIDGMHLFEYALRDFINIEPHAHQASVIVFDDVFPNHPLQAERGRQSRVWTGDVWKMTYCLRTHRPDLLLLPVDTSPTGLLMVIGLDPGNRCLSEKYSEIIQNFGGSPRREVPAEILERRGAVAPDSPKLAKLLRTLGKVRDNGKNQLIAEKIHTWRATFRLQDVVNREQE